MISGPFVLKVRRFHRVTETRAVSVGSFSLVGISEDDSSVMFGPAT